MRAQCISLLAVLLFMGMLIDGVASQPMEHAEVTGLDVDSSLDGAEKLGEGGGPVTLFADDMSLLTQQYFEASGIPSYYAGTAAHGSDAGRWRHEPLRWGTDSLEGPGDAWRRSDAAMDGVWHFGTLGPQPSYPAGSHAGVVTPVIDLTDVPDASVGASQTVATGIPSLVGVSGNTLNSVRPLVELIESLFQTLLGGGRTTQEVSEQHATAAFRLSHAYGFQTLDGGLMDGARVEVSFHDPLEGWTPWTGLSPSSSRLRIGDASLEGRWVPPAPVSDAAGSVTAGLGVPLATAAIPFAVGADPDEPSVRVSTGLVSGQETSVHVDADGPSIDSTPSDQPWQYQGTVPSSATRPGRPWQGFGGDSGGWVDSVFDLSPYVGHEVRLRFVAATQAGTFLPEWPGIGWLIDNVEVHALGEPTVRVMGLAVPGNEALVAPGTVFTPMISVVNPTNTPVRSDVYFRLEGPGEIAKAGHVTINLDGGVRGRALVALPISTSDLGGATEEGLYRVEVDVQTPLDVTASVKSAIGTTHHRTFHFLVGQGSGWEVLGTTMEPDETTEINRFVRRGEGLRLDASMQGFTSAGQVIPLVAKDGEPAALRLEFRDAIGQVVGLGVPAQEQVVLPPSREASGSLGSTDDIVEVTWHWDGHDVAETLWMVLVDAEGDQVFDAGRFRIDAEEPPVLVKDYGNDWNYAEGCVRQIRFEDRVGVVACSEDAAVVSPRTRVIGSDLFETNEAVLRVIHRGSLQAAIQFQADGQTDWVQLHSAGAEGLAWSVSDLPFSIPGPGHIQLLLSGDEAGAWIDETSVVIDGRSVLQASFASGLNPQSKDIVSSGSGSVWLTGRDDTPLAHDTGIQEQGVSLGNGGRYGFSIPVPGSSTNLEVMLDRGDIVADSPHVGSVGLVVMPGRLHQHIDSGRWTEDALLVWDEPIPLDDRARPTLRFKHWLDTGDGGLAAVQASTNGPEGPWETVMAFRGTTPGLETRSVSIPLDGLVGKEVHARLMFSSGPSTDFSRIGLGWLVEQVHISWWSSDGPQQAQLGEPVVNGGQAAQRIVRPSPTATIESDHASLRFTDALQCAERGYRPNTYAVGPALVTDLVDLTTAQRPLFTIEHQGAFGKQHLLNDRHELALVDLEYQVRDEDGQWPARWVRATPEDSKRNPSGVDESAPGRLEILGPDFYPFLFVRADYDPDLGGQEDLPSQGTLLQTSWDLAPLAGQEVRFRLLGWMEAVAGGKVTHATNSAGLYCIQDLDWNVLRVEVSERDHLINVATKEITIGPDHRDLLRVLDGQGFGGQGTPVLGNAVLATAEVTLQNKGILSARTQVQLTAGAASGEPLVSLYVDESGPEPVVTGSRLGIIDLEPGDTRVVRFVVDTRDALPGLYQLQADSRVLDGVDAVSADNERSLEFQVIPFRALSIDTASSHVNPFISTEDGARSVVATIRNQGNIRESGLAVEAALVRILGAGLQETLLELPTRSGSQVGTLSPGQGVARLEWVLPEGTMEELIEPGMDVAFQVTVNTPDLPGVGNDYSRNLQILLPFLVEDLILGTDFSAANSTSQLPELFGAQRPWAPETTVAGQPPQAGAGVPTWQYTSNTVASAAFPGHSTGNAWLLPAYSGFEPVEHTLTSPVLPSHVIAETSRGILDLRYASHTGPEQVFVEARTFVGDAPGPWVPIDDLRATRVAVVVPPDFPRVTGSQTEDVFGAYPTQAQGHPAPPFVDTSKYPKGECPAGQPPDFHTETNRCKWTPAYPDARSQGDPEWRAALDQILLDVAGRYGVHNVGLYTTLPEDIQEFPLPTVATSGGRALELVDAKGITLRFPIGSVEQLGRSLQNYGALLLLGDGLTDAKPAQSNTIVQLAQHSPGLLGADPMRVQHVDRLKAVLQEAPARGVKVVAGIGPAGAMIGYSGIARDVPLTVWQRPGIPMAMPVEGQLRCSTSNSDPGNSEFSNPQLQPKPACTRFAGIGQPPEVHPSHPRNYHYYPASDVRSLALRELLQSGGARFAASGSGLTGMGPVVLAPLVDHENEGVHFITAPYASNLRGWMDAITSVLSLSDGSLGEGDGAWHHSPPDLALPVGGFFRRDLAGDDRFAGEPMQVRVRVVSDPAAGGHGSFALDRVRLMGSPMQNDLGVRFVEPVHSKTYSPGSSFEPRVAVTNHGTQATGPQQIKVTATQFQGIQECPATPDGNPFVSFVLVPALRPGESTEVPVPGLLPGGKFPPCSSAGTVTTAFSFVAQIIGSGGEVSNNDVHQVDAFGRRIISVSISRALATPSLAVWANTEEVVLSADVKNTGTEPRNTLVSYEIRHATPRACRANGAYFSCEPLSGDENPGVLMQGEEHLGGLLRDQTRNVEFPISAPSLGPGIYRVTFTATVFDGTNPIKATATRWLHLTDPSLGPGQGGAAYGDGLGGLSMSLPAWPASTTDYGSASPDSTGFAASRAPARPAGVPDSQDPADPPLSHDGRYGPDAYTDDQDGTLLSHGWRVTDGDAWTVDGQVRALEWLRSERPSLIPAGGKQYRGQVTTASAQGDGDFGDDHIVWDRLTDAGSPFLTLASLEKPVLSFMSRFQASQNTGLVVEMQLADRQCQRVQFQGIVCQWQWDTSWIPLVEETASSSPMDARFRDRQAHFIPPEGQSITYRLSPSNPLAGLQGIWDAQSMGAHAAADGWQRMRYPIDLSAIDSHCRVEIGVFQEGAEMASEPCRYALAQPNVADTEPGGEIPRPVRFRFRAASFGGDDGVNFWRIDDVALTGQGIRFAASSSASRSLQDGTSAFVPMLLRNDGTVHDQVLLTWDFAEFSIPDVDVRFGISAATTDASSLTVSLSPGESKVVWARLSVGYGTGNPPNSKDVPLPIVVVARSIHTPLVRETFLIDARFDVGSYADLVVTGIGVGSDLGEDAASASENTHVTVTVLVRNIGGVAVPGDTVEVVLIEQLVDEAGKELSLRVATDAAGNPARAVVGQVVPFRSSADEVAVQLGWSPPQIGAYKLIAQVNRAVLGDPAFKPLAESNLHNNVLSRVIKVGPVLLPDLRITQADLVDFHTGDVVDRVVVGHLYQIETTVENRGSAAAVDASVDFRIGAGDFGTRTEALFPPIPAVRSFTSAVWNATLPFDGTEVWEFNVDVFSPTPSDSTLGKAVAWQLPVEFYRFLATDVPEQLALAPGGEVRAEINITNRGNVPATPSLRDVGGPVRVHLEGTSTIAPGGTDNITLVFVTAHGVKPDDALPGIVLTSVENSLLRVPLPTKFVIASKQDVSAAALSLHAPPGPVVVEIALENNGNSPATWTLNETSGHLGATAPWWFTQPAFNRTVVSLPLDLLPSALPGPLTGALKLSVNQGTLETLIEVPVGGMVEPLAGLQASVVRPAVVAGRGHAGMLELVLENTGNIPVEAVYHHAIDFGNVTDARPQAPLKILPAQHVTVRAEVRAGPSDITLGRTEVSWWPDGTIDARNETIEWQVTFGPRGFQIVDSDLFRLRAKPAQTVPVRVTVLNPLDIAQQAELLLLADGILHSRAEAHVGAGEEIQRTLYLKVGPAGQSQEVQLIVRPTGSDLHPGQAAFYDVGDVALQIVAAASGDGGRFTPGPDMVAALAVLLAAQLVRRRRL